ncbi:hypothetical protein LTR62_005416 [Meristemomyces frigidus]|uniref:DUF7704 domain-containing protein n=1 Tax=Meristemomyces frigidus TaxID=1508187 RepID=A0AAN7YQX1_9PEZI|nr:hypothetical protein LTR62_005416 [Meristemomyces frigidus]
MARSLTLWPRTLFGIIEPGLLCWAYYTLLLDPKKFYLDHYPVAGPLSITQAPTFAPQSEILVLLLGNVYLLLALLALVCVWTPCRPVAIRYLLVVALADLGHIYAFYRVWGGTFWDFGQWNDLMWGNVGVSVFLHVNRLATVMGVFGSERG